ncbi:hypothetical protein [Vagococcus fluvialis]|uniref:hypothetical protein n=1 Tax=Vagococcus fluvialis TaxID=2738 RepID=UPI001D0A711F|nr:hypothetical protein [Vagococcus fluvialis]UDM84092.1 hypothetical protein K5K96_15215 [Vagococcus fluvialis]
MKKVINGRTYNTKTSLEIASYYNQKIGHDVLEETLYLTKKGDYFLYYYGGGLTKYAISVANNQISESKGIKVLTEKQAKNFIEKYRDNDYFVIYKEI